MHGETVKFVMVFRGASRW